MILVEICTFLLYVRYVYTPHIEGCFYFGAVQRLFGGKEMTVAVFNQMTGKNVQLSKLQGDAVASGIETQLRRRFTHTHTHLDVRVHGAGREEVSKRMKAQAGDASFVSHQSP